MKKRVCLTAIFFVLLDVLSLSLGTFSNTAEAASKGYDPVTQVVVARDMTASANCTSTVNGTTVSCPTGSVIGTFFVSEAEAKKNGESYIRLSGNKGKDNPAVDKLMKEAGQKYSAARNLQLRSLIHANTVRPNIIGCGGYSTVYNQYTASNFDSPQPTIGYSADYSLAYSSDGTCDYINISHSYTYFVNSGSNAYLYATAFNPTGGDLSNGWFPGNANIPHDSNYPANSLNGYIGWSFTDEVNSGGIFSHSAYGYYTFN